jgi:hypothetical protein
MTQWPVCACTAFYRGQDHQRELSRTDQVRLRGHKNGLGAMKYGVFFFLSQLRSVGMLCGNKVENERPSALHARHQLSQLPILRTRYGQPQLHKVGKTGLACH